MQNPGESAKAFTLIELLVVIAIIAVMAGMLLPVLSGARLRSKIVSVHSDLRQFGIAIEMYKEDRGGYPFARLSCSENQEIDYYEMPRELYTMGYIPAHRILDPFNQETNGDLDDKRRTYKYVVIGWQYSNNFKVPGGMWIPGNYPTSTKSCYYYYEEKGKSLRIGTTLKPEAVQAPVKWAVWSVGPGGDPGWTQSSALMQPVPKSEWYPYNPKGVIVHLSDGRTSP
ncbi:MAG: type II secretion system protein [Armatimonadota bacterium]